MTQDPHAALHTALAYYQAWTRGDFDSAMAYIADDIVCQAPAGSLEGAEAFRAFMGPFAGGLIRSELIAAFGDQQTAMLMYDTEAALVRAAPGAEFHSVKAGRIVRMRIIFDRLPFVEARRAAAAP